MQTRKNGSMRFNAFQYSQFTSMSHDIKMVDASVKHLKCVGLLLNICDAYKWIITFNDWGTN